MATSGTIGSTVIDFAKLLEKSIRRCGLLPGQLTPETVVSAQESAYMFLLSMAGRGINLWCVERNLLPLTVGQARYLLPVGTIDVLNLLHATPSRVTGTDTSGATHYTTELTEPSSVVRFGVKFSTLPTISFVFQSSDDGVAWTTVQTVSAANFPSANVWGWYDVDPAVSAKYFRLFSATFGVVDDFFLVTAVREIDIPQFNRDDYANQPNKTFQSRIATNYYFEKLIDPEVTVWPVPSDDTSHLVLFRHRQIQDIGTMINEVEIPDRWLEPVSWHLALRLAYELPGVDPERRKELVSMAGAMTIETEGSENDGAPVYFAPNIRGYTR